MSISTYIKYGVLAVAALVVTAAGVRSQVRSEPAAVQAGSAAATNGCWPSQVTDQVQWQRDVERFQEDMKRQSKDLRARAREIQSEVAKEMVENGLTNRANLEKLTAQRAGLTAEVQAASGQVQELFSQASGLVDANDDTGWLGVEISEVTAEKAKELKLPRVGGVIVSEVVPDSPSARAGVKSNDVILEYDGQPIEGTVQFGRLVRETPPGRSVNLAVDRGGHDEKLTVEVGNRVRSMNSRLLEVLPPRNFNFKFSMPEIFPGITPVLGVEAEDVAGQLGTYFHVPGGEGVLIREVTPNSPAAKAGLRAGDVITQLNGTAIKTVGDLRDNLRDKRDVKTVSLTVIREGLKMPISVTLDAPMPHPAKTRTAAL